MKSKSGQSPAVKKRRTRGRVSKVLAASLTPQTYNQMRVTLAGCNTSAFVEAALVLALGMIERGEISMDEFVVGSAGKESKE